VLWLALHFPLLPIEALPLRQPPSAVVARGRVQVADEAAVAAGVRAGQKLSTALGLQPGLAVFERDVGRERQALESLACWAGRFTPTISLQPPDTLLLEIGGCLRLFGGAGAIIAAVLAGCAEQSYSVRWAAAPTPLGARWLAQAGGGIKVDAAGLPAALAALPCAVPGWPGEVTNRLESFGLKRLGELYQMPGAGLRRRIGNGPVDDLLRAWGDCPIRNRPSSFRKASRLPSNCRPVSSMPRRWSSPASACSRRWPAGCMAGSCWFAAARCNLSHDDGPPTALALNFAEPAADEGRFMRLLREHLGRLQLAAPVEALRLQADELVDQARRQRPSVRTGAAGEGALACLERLRARLGEGRGAGAGRGGRSSAGMRHAASSEAFSILAKISGRP
jgi:protein ImuB